MRNSVAWLRLDVRRPGRQHALDTIATLSHQRQHLPDGRERSRKPRADFGVAIGRERPVERSPDVVELATAARHIIAAQPGSRAGRYWRDEIPEILGMAPRGARILAILGELLQRIGAYRLQQTPSRWRTSN